MKRTIEVRIGIAGIVFSALLTIAGLFFVWLSNSKKVISQVEDDLVNDPTLDLSPDEIYGLLQIAGIYGWVLIGAAILGTVLGIIAVKNIKENKKPKLAGSLFIIASAITGVMTIGLGLIAAILYLISGSMCFMRKAPPETTEQI